MSTEKVEKINPTVEGKVDGALSGQESQSPLQEYRIIAQRRKDYLDIAITYKDRLMFSILVDAAENRVLKDDIIHVFTPNYDSVYIISAWDFDEEIGRPISRIEYVSVDKIGGRNVVVKNLKYIKEIEVYDRKTKRRRYIKLGD